MTYRILIKTTIVLAGTWPLWTLSGCSERPQNPDVPATETQGQALEQGALLLHSQDLTSARLESVEQTLSLNGSLSAREQALVRSKVSGFVLETRHREGESVTAGQVIAQIDPSEARLRLLDRQAAEASARARLKQATLDHENAKALVAQSFMSEAAAQKAAAELDAARALLESAKAQTELARRNLSDHDIKTPIAGVLGTVRIKKGDKVSPDSALFEVYDLSMLELRALAAPSQALQIQPGMTAEISAEGLPGSLPAQVEQISPSTEAGSRSVPVILSVANPALRLKAGLFATAQVVTGSARPRLMIPASAVREDQGRQIVYRVLDGRIAVTEVSLGLQTVLSGGKVLYVEVLSGLVEGDTLIAVNLGPMGDGLPVQVQTLD